MKNIVDDSFTYITYEAGSNRAKFHPNPNLDVDRSDTIDAIRTDFEAALDEAISKGATGFHEYNAEGINDAKNKYNRYTSPSMTKEEALAKFDEYVAAGGTGKMFIAPSFKAPAPTPTPVPDSQGGGSGGSSSGSGSAMNGSQLINTANNLPQGTLINNVTLMDTLLQYPQNQIAQPTNVKDLFGNQGFGYWQQVPNTTTWYFLTRDIGANGTKGSVGFLSDGWYNLSWKGQDHWYHFDKEGKMQLGWWLSEDNKVYYFEEDTTSNWYGRAVTGQYTTAGRAYNFDTAGVLVLN